MTVGLRSEDAWTKRWMMEKKRKKNLNGDLDTGNILMKRRR